MRIQLVAVVALAAGCQVSEPTSLTSEELQLTCVDYTSDPNNCGYCGDVCPAGTSCETGTCLCPDGTKPGLGGCGT